MIRKGDTIRYEGGHGTVDKTSSRTGCKLYRVNDCWFPKRALVKV